MQAIQKMNLETTSITSCTERNPSRKRQSSRVRLQFFADRGIICVDYGHNWEDSTPNFMYTGMTLDGSHQQRQCVVCGIREVLIPSHWEEIEE